MGNALIQLVAVGPQNVMINGKPEATLFQSYFKRVTMFAMESVKQSFNGSVGFGNRVQCQIARNGDLLSKMVLEVQLPGLSSTLSGWVNDTDITATVNYVNDVGYHLLKEVELEIGGISIVKHYGRWMHIWQELTRPSEKDAAHNKMIGGSGANLRSDLTATNTTETNGAKTLSAPGKLYIPLQFWFCNNYSLAFPLIACQYHEVKVNITFENLSNLARSSFTTNGDDVLSITAPTAVGSLSADLYVDYIFLDNDERRKFATSAHEYLIEQLQYPSAESHADPSSGATLNRRLDGFNHPVKELVFVVQEDAENTTGQPSNFANGTAQTVDTAKLILNGNDRFSERSGEYFNWVQPYMHHTRAPSTGIYVYSFATEPEKHQPTGTCNFSRIDTAQLQIKLLGDLDACTSHVYMVNYNVLRLVSGMAGLTFAA